MYFTGKYRKKLGYITVLEQNSFFTAIVASKEGCSYDPLLSDKH